MKIFSTRFMAFPTWWLFSFNLGVFSFILVVHWSIFDYDVKFSGFWNSHCDDMKTEKQISPPNLLQYHIYPLLTVSKLIDFDIT